MGHRQEWWLIKIRKEKEERIERRRKKKKKKSQRSNTNRVRKKVCPKCLRKKPSTLHHILPKRHFRKGRSNKFVIRLCWECHATLETLIPFDKQHPWVYEKILNFFLTNEVDWLVHSLRRS